MFIFQPLHLHCPSCHVYGTRNLSVCCWIPNPSEYWALKKELNENMLPRLVCLKEPAVCTSVGSLLFGEGGFSPPTAPPRHPWTPSLCFKCRLRSKLRPMTIWDFKTLESSIQGLRIMWSWASLQTQPEEGPAAPGQRCHSHREGSPQPGNTEDARGANLVVCFIWIQLVKVLVFFQSSSDLDFVWGLFLFCFAISFHFCLSCKHMAGADFGISLPELGLKEPV